MDNDVLIQQSFQGAQIGLFLSILLKSTFFFFFWSNESEFFLQVLGKNCCILLITPDKWYAEEIRFLVSSFKWFIMKAKTE